MDAINLIWMLNQTSMNFAELCFEKYFRLLKYPGYGLKGLETTSTQLEESRKIALLTFQIPRIGSQTMRLHWTILTKAIAPGEYRIVQLSMFAWRYLSRDVKDLRPLFRLFPLRKLVLAHCKSHDLTPISTLPFWSN